MRPVRKVPTGDEGPRQSHTRALYWSIVSMVLYFNIKEVYTAILLLGCGKLIACAAALLSEIELKMLCYAQTHKMCEKYQ